MTGRQADARSGLALIALLALAALPHLLLTFQPEASIRRQGDEQFYFKNAPILFEGGEHSLVPGRLDFADEQLGGVGPRWRPKLIDTLRHRSPLSLNVFAFLVPRDVSQGRLDRASKEVFFRRIRLLHLGLFWITLASLYAQGRLLGLGPAGSLAAPALLATSPWFGFYVNSAFAEPLRAALANVALVWLLAYLRFRRLALLLPAAVFWGYAVFARASFLPFSVVVIALVAASAWNAAADRALRQRALGAVAAGAIFAVCLCAVVGPQLYVNARRGMGLDLATNTWRNFDLGLRSPSQSDPDFESWWQEAKEQYFDAGTRYGRREREARARTLAFLHETSIPELLLRQGGKWLHVLLKQDNRLDLGVEQRRWRGQADWIGRLRTPSRMHGYAVLALGLLGLARVGWRSLGWMLLSGFALFHFAALLAVPIVPRFLIPVLPTLCLLAAGFLTHLPLRVHAATRPGRLEARPKSQDDAPN
jgi:hypothetical protein